MIKIYSCIILLVLFGAGEIKSEVPIQGYRYEAKDVMETAATTVPIRSHRSLHETYYPQGGGILNGYSDVEGYGGRSFIGGGSGIGLGGGIGGYQGGISRIGSGGYVGGINSGAGGGFAAGGGLHGGGLQGGYVGGAGFQPGLIGAGNIQGGLVGGPHLHSGLIGAGSGLGGGYIGGGAGIGNGIGIRSVGLGASGVGLGAGGVGLGAGGVGLGAGGIGLGAGGIGLGTGGVGLGASGVGIGAGGGLGGGFIGGGQGGLIAPLHHIHGGEVIDKSVYSGGKKNLNDGSFGKASGQSGGQLNQGQNSFSQGNTGAQSSQGNLGYYNDQKSGKNAAEDGRSYTGSQQINQLGQNADEKKQQAGHKKGHVVKGFKSSHHKDEDGKTEEFYDEAHDDSDNFNFQGQNGRFGQGSQAAFQGGHDDRFFNADERQNRGNYNAGQFLNNNNGNQGQYGQNKYLGNGQAYGVNNGIDQQSLLGHQESNRFFKHHPYFH